MLRNSVFQKLSVGGCCPFRLHDICAQHVKATLPRALILTRYTARKCRARKCRATAHSWPNSIAPPVKVMNDIGNTIPRAFFHLALLPSNDLQFFIQAIIILDLNYKKIGTEVIQLLAHVLKSNTVQSSSSYHFCHICISYSVLRHLLHSISQAIKPALKEHDILLMH